MFGGELSNKFLNFLRENYLK